MTRVRPTQHEKDEWLRMSAAAFNERLYLVGRRFAEVAALGPRADLRIDVFDSLQAEYRAWLVFGEWPAYGRAA